MSVASILQAMAENAGRAKLQRGALIGGAIADLSQVPGQMLADRDRQQLLARKQAIENEQLGFQRSANARSEKDQAMQDKAAQLAEEKTQHMNAVIGAGFGDDPNPANFNMEKAAAKAQEIGRPDLIPLIGKVHSELLPKLTSGAPGSVMRDEAGKVVAGSEIPATPTAETSAARQRFLQSKKQMTGALPPAEQSEYDAYNEVKRPVSDPAALAAEQRRAESMNAATDRATAATASQAANQKRGQDFAEAQAGRAELTNKVEQPYQAQANAAQVLRDTVKAAQGGNKLAASMQSLEAAMAAVKGQGFNRINMAEIALPAGAGSAWDRLQGWMGKAKSGQPVPADIQKDMLDFADVMEKAAHKKYLEGHTSITKRYGLKDEKALPAPGAAPKRVVYDMQGNPVK